MIRALAVVCVRNEAIHIRRCLEHLIGSGLEVYLIDNQSTDGTREIASEFLAGG
jgi:glycosyltransferase involved in cell wall biosynthesis